jgi:hypothetical protein
MEICRWEFVAITLLALTGEMSEGEFIYLREDALAAFDWDTNGMDMYYNLEAELD